MSDQVRINNLLSSIIWTAAKLQKINDDEYGFCKDSEALLKSIDNLLDRVLDYEETHV